MSTEAIASHIADFAAYANSAPVLIFVFIIVFMAIESSFIPFPSEVVMIPAGFLVARPEITLLTGHPVIDLAAVILAGLAGSMIGAYVNFFLSMWLGRPFLYKYGKYFFLKPQALERAEEVFREYGEMVTFVCRLIPAIRQLISIPAGLSKMNFTRFSIFTALGAGIWGTVLALIGYYFGRMFKDMSYLEMVEKGKALIAANYIWIFLGLAILAAGYILIHKKIMTSSRKSA